MKYIGATILALCVTGIIALLALGTYQVWQAEKARIADPSTPAWAK